MMNYQELIEKAKLIRDVETTTTTGDLDYPGTALEICDQDGEDLFHFVLDKTGKIQILFFANEDNYRVPIEVLEKIIVKAREVVKKAD